MRQEPTIGQLLAISQNKRYWPGGNLGTGGCRVNAARVPPPLVVPRVLDPHGNVDAFMLEDLRPSFGVSQPFLTMD